MSADDPVQPGDILSGKFRVERVLGIGGMGVVVAATHLQLGQLVALKFMLKQALQYPDNVARFEREARAAVRLRSDHVAKVTDVGRLDDDAPYMVMEFLEGEDLDRYMRTNGPLPIQVAVDFLLQACEAIAEAHALGIVHRDLKPKNLFLTQRLNGEPLVKVLDFGVSKIIGQQELSLTATTQVLGSPSYMSPEQLRASRDVDQRTDIWALGAILYELLTGSVPFPAQTLTQLTAMVIAEPPRPIESLRSDLPNELRVIVLKCLEKKVEDRFQTVSDLALALAQFASPSSRQLATHRMGTSSSSRLSAVPATSDRPSIRAPGSNTDVAWDKTELAAPRKKILPIAIFVGLAAAIVGAIVFVKLIPHGTPPAATAPQTPTAPATVTVTTTVTVTVTAPAPTNVTTATAPATTTAATTIRPTTHKDAGAHPTSSSSGGLDLPSTRN